MLLRLSYLLLIYLFYLFGVLRHFQHCTGHITMGSWKGKGNQYIQLVKVLYCKLPTNGKQLPAFPVEAMPRIEPRPQRWEARVLLLCHHGPQLPTTHCNDIIMSLARVKGYHITHTLSNIFKTYSVYHISI